MLRKVKCLNMERGKTFRRFQCGWEFIPNDGCSNRESTLAQVQLSSGNRKMEEDSEQLDTSVPR